MQSPHQAHSRRTGLQPVLDKRSLNMVVLYLLFTLLASAAADHSGAYSSPQYAKKMYPKQAMDTNQLLPRDMAPIRFKYQSIDRFDANDTTQYARSSFVDSASGMLNSAGGQLISGLFKDFMARSTGSSQVGLDCITQVLSLNLTNLLILIVLKALILAAGFFGAGAWKEHHYGRSIDDNMNASYLTEDEIMLYLSYLTGQQTKNYECLYQLSCQKPQQAAMYSSGAELLLQGAKLMQSNSMEFDEYEDIAKNIKEAVTWGEDGMPCNKRYHCGDDKKQNFVN